MEKKINKTLVLSVHKHGKRQFLYIPKRQDAIIPKGASLVEVELKKVIA